MGREIRRVPANWQHPKNENGYIPLFDEYYLDALNKWWEGHNLWLRGEHPDQQERDDGSKEDYKFYANWDGDPPSVESYRNESWTEEQATCYQIYETVSEGTPISPVFGTQEEMKKWLISEGHSKHAAERFIEQEWAPSMVIYNGKMGQGIDSFDI